MTLLGSIPVWNDDEATISRCYRALARYMPVIVYQGAISGVVEQLLEPGAPAELRRGVFASHAAMRQHGLDWGARRGAEWVLQIDSDDRLVNGHLLAPLLASGRFARAYPMPVVQENGDWLFSPFKCVRVPAHVEASCDHLIWPGDPHPWLCSGYPPPPLELRANLLELPHLAHEPSRRRRPVASRPFAEIEGQERIPDTPRWPLELDGLLLTPTKEPR